MAHELYQAPMAHEPIAARIVSAAAGEVKAT
jgi:hypothetical protein